ncbi:serine-rich adhesin for platelets-like [Ptychodera flava]|uniref:serine-rich adhesin for platelets-like n=1 Tax=Ptychodera flava TaxID=63121 RepID=UPI00396A9CB9
MFTLTVQNTPHPAILRLRGEDPADKKTDVKNTAVPSGQACSAASAGINSTAAQSVEGKAAGETLKPKKKKQEEKVELPWVAILGDQDAFFKRDAQGAAVIAQGTVTVDKKRPDTPIVKIGNLKKKKTTKYGRRVHFSSVNQVVKIHSSGTPQVKFASGNSVTGTDKESLQSQENVSPVSSTSASGSVKSSTSLSSTSPRSILKVSKVKTNLEEPKQNAFADNTEDHDTQKRIALHLVVTPSGVSDPAMQTVTLSGVSDPAMQTVTPNGVSDPAMQTVTPNGVSDPAMQTVTLSGVSDSAMETVTPNGASDPTMQTLTLSGVSDSAMQTVTLSGVSDSAMQTVTLSGVSDSAMETVTPNGVSDPAMQTVTPNGISDPAMQTVTPNCVSDPAMQTVTPNGVSDPAMQTVTQNSVSDPTMQTVHEQTTAKKLLMAGKGKREKSLTKEKPVSHLTCFSDKTLESTSVKERGRKSCISFDENVEEGLKVMFPVMTTPKADGTNPKKTSTDNTDQGASLDRPEFKKGTKWFDRYEVDSILGSGTFGVLTVLDGFDAAHCLDGFDAAYCLDGFDAAHCSRWL